jgi:phosphatidylglycerol---prolipoprotein diacylglyceryl transferase
MLPKIGVIDTYPVLIIIGILACLAYLEVYFRKTKAVKHLGTAVELNALFAILCGLLFSLLFQNLYDFIENPTTYHWVWDLTFYGGLIGGVLGFLAGYFLVIRKRFGASLGSIAIIAPAAITVAHGFGRIGCFLNGCCYGKPTDSWIGIKFTTTSGKVYPTNLMEAIFLLLLSGVLLFLALKGKGIFNFAIYMIGYGIFRFGIEYLRGDDRGDFVPGLSPSQFWSILLVVGGIVYLIFFLMKIRKAKKEAEK